MSYEQLYASRSNGYEGGSFFQPVLIIYEHLKVEA